MNRRTFLTGTLAGLATTLSGGAALAAREPLVTTIVEVANFNCSRCYAVNSNYDRLARLAYNVKKDLVFAPATWEGQSLWPSRVYYSMRDLYPRTEQAARNTLFHGIHQDGQVFETLSQVAAYFERNQTLDAARNLDPDFDWAQVAARSETNEPLYSEIRATRLIEMAGVQDVPTFIWLVDGKLTQKVSPDQAQDPAKLALLVENRIKGLL